MFEEADYDALHRITSPVPTIILRMFSASTSTMSGTGVVLLERACLSQTICISGFTDWAYLYAMNEGHMARFIWVGEGHLLCGDL